VSTLTEIREAITHLTLAERAELMAELCAWEDDDWDRQMKNDARSGKFDTMNRQALDDLQADRCRSLESNL
jgi:hypothetical protein